MWRLVALSAVFAMAFLMLVGCAAGEPDYEITRTEDIEEWPGGEAAQLEIDTKTTEKEELRAIAREIKESEEYEGYDALNMRFIDSEEGFAEHGSATAVMSRAGADFVGVQPEELTQLEEDGDGIFFQEDYMDLMAEGIEEETPPADEDPSLEEEPDTAVNAQEETPAPDMTAGGVGDAVPFVDSEFRALDVFETDSYTYIENVYYEDDWTGQDAIPTAGKFIVVSYSVRNTSSGSIEAGFNGILDSQEGEYYEESSSVFHPPTLYSGLDLPPRGVGVGQFVFDVPQDVEAVALHVGITDEVGEPIGEGATIDLTTQNPQEPGPEEILALYYEYGNMQEWEKTYELFSEESRQRVSEEQYVAYWADSLATITDYSFPQVDIQGDRATVSVVRTQEDSEGREQLQLDQPMVLEEVGWRLEFRDDQIQTFVGG